nr:retrovirus-related Pol polyprotein from transposon TNT 1-94 [Tanacetum cinerariifolium]
MEDRVMLNNSKGTKQEVEDQRRNVKLSKNKMSITACNDSLNAKTLNVNFVCATCGKCVLNEKHDMCVLKSRNDENSRTKMPIVVPVSTREPKCTVTQSVAKPLKKTVASESNQKPRNITRKLYERISIPLCQKLHCLLILLQLVEIVLFIVDSGCSKYMTGYLKLLINFVEKFSGTVKFGNNQIAPILGYGDLVQGAVTIKRVYYVEGLNHNLFSVDQFCDADLEVAFRKSTCYIRVLKGNDLLTGSRGTDLYSITLQDTNSPNPICLMAKAKLSQAWLWHHRLSHLNFDTINLLSKNDIVVGLTKLKFVKDHLCSSCELGKAKRKSFHTKTTPSLKRPLQLLHMDLCGPMRVANINGKRYVLVIVDDYSRYTWTHFLRSKDETPEIHQSPCGIFINQAKYAQEILIKHGMTSCDSVGTPMAMKHLDADLSETPIDQTKYRSMVGALMYLTTSRPDIMHATCYCARYQAKPIEKHLTAVKRIFRYLKDTIHMGLWYLKDTGFELTAFLYSDHVGCLDSPIAISCNPVQHSRTKHIDVRYHFIKEKVKKGIVELFFIGTEYQLADLFTKALPEERFKYLVRRLGMRCLTPDELEVLANESA